MILGHHPVNAILVNVEIIKARLKVDKDKYQQTNGNTRRKTRDIDDRIRPVPHQLTVRSLELIVWHGKPAAKTKPVL
jgi:hypothetical protein